MRKAGAGLQLQAQTCGRKHLLLDTKVDLVYSYLTPVQRIRLAPGLPRQLQQRTLPKLQRNAECSLVQHAVYATYASSEERHAVLHDFCMAIPFSMMVIIGGVLSIFFGNGWAGLLLAALAALQLFLTLQSLRRWREGGRHRIFTATTAGLAGGFAQYAWGNIQRKVAVWPNRLLFVLSLAATTFLVYNILAGGNPPKEDAAVTAADASSPQKKY